MESKIAPSTNSDQPGSTLNEDRIPPATAHSIPLLFTANKSSEISYSISSIFPANKSETNSPYNDHGNSYSHSIQSFFPGYMSTSEISVESSSTHEYDISATTVGLSDAVHKARTEFAQEMLVLHDTVKNEGSKALMFKPILKRLESTLDRLAPVCREMGQLKEQFDSPESETKSLIEEMKKGAKLVRKCSKIRWWNYSFKGNYSDKLCELDEAILRFCEVNLQVQSTRNGLHISISETVRSFGLVETPGVSCAVSIPPDFTVGLDMPMKELKTLLLKEEVQLLLLTAPEGCGKTTLVQMLSQDEQIQGTFKDNILYVKVSQTPNVKVIVQNLFSYKGVRPAFQIQSDEDAIDQLPQLLSLIECDPILLILDDVLLGSESLPEKFKFDIPNYKILVTSRIAFPRFEFTYNLKPLNEVDATELFLHSASLQDGSSNIPEEDIKKIVRVCGGFPLALKVIGGSLCGQHPLVWKSRLMDWSQWSDGQPFFNSNTELLAHLQKSLEFPDDKVNVKECSMDLASFPELEHFKKGSSSSKTIGTVDINLMDDFVEMERIVLVSADKPFGDSHASRPLETELNGDSSELKGREIVPLSDSESGFIVSNQEIRSKDTKIGKVPGWLQDVLKVVLEQNRVTHRNPDEILEDIKAALVYINRPNLREVVDARQSSNNPDASNPLPLNGYIYWKPSNGHHIQMEELHSNVREENRKLREEFMNSESAKKDLEGRLQSATDKSESQMNQLLESEKTIVSLQTELETLKESKGRIEDHIGSQKLMNEDQDRQLAAARVELNEARHKFSSLEVELDNKNSCCKELEATCLELQLQLDSITKKKSLNHDLNQEEKQLRIDWEITAASEKLAECQEAILNMGKQLKALAAPREAALFDKVIATPTDTITTTTATARATTPSPNPTPPKDKSMNQHCSQMDQMLAADDAAAKALKSTKIKEIDGNSTREDNGAFQPLERIPVLNGVKHEDDNNTAGSLAIVPTKKRGGGSFWRKPLWRKKKRNSKKSKNISSIAP